MAKRKSVISHHTPIFQCHKLLSITLLYPIIKMMVYVTIINLCAPNTGAPKYINQILTELKGEVDCDSITTYINGQIKETENK